MPESLEKNDKRESGVTKVAGVGPDTEKAILEFFGRRFSLKEKLPFEKEKSAELNQMISQISNYMKEFAAEYSAKSLDIPPENIHILDETKMPPERKEMIFKKVGKVPAVFSLGEQQIFIFHVPPWASNSLGLARFISHEMLHNISFQRAELKPDQGGKMKGIIKITGRREGGDVQTMVILPRRMGFKIMVKDKKKDKEIAYFHFLDEAIITELTMRFDWRYFSKIPLIAEGKEYKTREEYYENFSNQEARDKARRKYALAWDLENYQIDGENVVSAQIIPREYEQQREKLNELIDELYEQNKDKFGDREEVFDVFARAVMTGRLLPVARLIEKTFGKGSFREIGEDSGIGPDKEKNKQE